MSRSGRNTIEKSKNRKIRREKPKIEKLQEILGGPDPADDDGWADVVEKKSVVATGGKQVSDLM